MRLSAFLADLAELLAPHRRLVLAVVLGLLIDAGFQTALPLSLKLLIDRAIVPADRELLWQLVLVLSGGLLLAAVAMLWRDHLYARLGAAVLRGVRERLFAHLQTLSLTDHARMRPGDLMARFTTDLASVEQLVVGALPNVFGALLSLLMLGIALVALSLELSAVVGVLLPLCWIGPRWLLPRAAALSLESRRREGDVLSLLQEQIDGQAAVRALGLERHATARLAGRLEAAQLAAQRFNFASYVAERLPNIGMLVLHVAILVWGAYLAFEGRISVGTLVAYNAVLLSLGAAVATLTSSVNVFLGAAAGLRRIREILDLQPSVGEAPGARRFDGMHERLSFEDVGFSHGDQPILRNLSLVIGRGQSVALVGPSGSGKSTALNLVARFLDPHSGRVAIDGEDLRGFTQESLRGRLGIVQQDTVLFEGSLRDNLRLGRLDASDAQLEAAARLAEVETFARALPQGYDTALGAQGVRLSGGQRQRIAIARALLRQPDLLLLDEATSALDPATERAINGTLEGLRGSLTMIRVTHRLAEAAGCDRIFVLDGGRLVEQGSQAELLAMNGLYAKLWRKQQGLKLSDNAEHAAVTAAWLSEWPLFEGADPVRMEEVCREFVTERVGLGATIIREGEPGERFYILVRGRVAVTRLGAGGEPKTLARLHEGDAFGEAALLSDAPRNASVQALSDCVLLSLERSRFRRWLQGDAAWRRRVQELAGRGLKSS